jgi:DNA-binding NarL/FixJ family response regulator
MRIGIEPDVDIVGETGKIGEALYLAQALAPDAIILDIGMSDDEWTSVKRLRAAAPGAVLVALTLRDDSNARLRAQEAGVQAYLEKNGGGGDLLQAIRQVVGNATAERGPNMEQNQGRSV